MTDSRCLDAETLAAYVDGRIDDDELAGISNHLIDCERCYQTVAAAARFLVARDRGQNVRTVSEYLALAEPYFPNIQHEIRSNLLRIPYTHIIAECVQG